MLMWWAAVGEAWHAMGANRLRSFLTMLGMMIGVAAVVLMLAVGQGARDAVKRQIESMGSNLFIVLAGSQNTGGARIGSGNAVTLTSDDAEAIAELPGVVAAAPMVFSSQQVVYGNNNWGTQIFGTNEAYVHVRDWEIARGDNIDSDHVTSSRRVAVLGQTVVENLFGDEDPLGKTFRIRNSSFTVIGVLAHKGQSLDGRDQDDTILVPYSSASRSLFWSRFRNSVRMILVQAESERAMPQVQHDMTELLRDRHRIGPGMEDDFYVNNLTAAANAAAEVARTMSLLLGAIASVSLVVGGIGIMNIMLVSVTERTREIGIRMAIGARRRDLLSQFLVESLLLSLTGGLIGVLVGVGGAWLVEEVWKTQGNVTTAALTVAFVISAGIGVFFGFYPALKASRLDPIEALRYQ